VLLPFPLLSRVCALAGVNGPKAAPPARASEQLGRRRLKLSSRRHRHGLGLLPEVSSRTNPPSYGRVARIVN